MVKPTELRNMQQAIALHADMVRDFMSPENLQPNVMGLGVGEKIAGGVPTGEAALIALVTHKVPMDDLRESDRIQSRYNDIPTDVLEVGYPVAQQATARPPVAEPYTPAPTAPNQRNGNRFLSEVRTFAPPISEYESALLTPMAAVPARRERPAYGGDSVGHFKITAGTIATCVYDILPGGSVNPPVPGTGVPPKFYILSNNHVLANSNAAAPGDPILQPGSFDGGVFPDDKIATLTRFVPITFEPPVPRALHRNLVDAAIAETHAFEIERDVHWVGVPRAWRKRSDITIGMRVKKFGRTTGLTLGRVIAIHATVDVGYGAGVARFMDQIITTNISAGGDSGSLVVSEDNVAIGLLFAGSPTVTICNYIEHVRSLLRIEVAELIG